jgi:hypothetical protein
VQAADYGAYVGIADGSSTGAHVIDVTASLAAWAANPAANRGWIFRPTGTNGVDFWSSEHDTLSARPSLTVEYAPPLTFR